ncbi:MAG: helix-turn-helix domain-containing protein [Ktedonobacteraceae bacterium]|nr:helix-turn-helix domain-containing protein [Ktedonobacteraceae bacterium]
MTALITLSPLEGQMLINLRCRYEEASDAETRTRYQMLLLSLQGQTSSQIAQIVLRSQDTVVRVLNTVLNGRVGCCPPTNSS